ncbi:fibronectin type III domain-containing protein [Rathayibacter sp. VKM Ac-2630]|uniref:fibronectin type III domain-containing protein n=1 Tax=Rathayibacter sp. VKM Ac-2630 TaxID=1938617 RepID=UPI001115A26B|nr:fibronectin type III domain-containing protein [Rathayibacter sp. VKM Ac-2630]
MGFGDGPFGEGPFGGEVVPPPTPPLAPVSVAVSEFWSTGAVFTWDGPTPLGYRVRLNGEGIATAVEEPGAELLELTPETAYTVAVSANRVDGVETFSEPVSFTTPASGETPPIEEPEEPEEPEIPEEPEEPGEPEIPGVPETPADAELRWKTAIGDTEILNEGSSEGIVVADDAINTPDYTSYDLWTNQLARRLNTTSVNHHNGGRTRIDVALAMLTAGTSAFKPNVHKLCIQAAGGNDVGHFWNTEVGKRGFKNATSMILGITRSKSKVLPGGAGETGTWTQSEKQYSGSTRKSIVPGSTQTITFTGVGATLAMLGYTDHDGGDLNGSPYTWSIDGSAPVARSTKSQGLTGTDKTVNSVQPIHFMGLTPGTHTVVITHTGAAGDPLIVDSLHVWQDTVQQMPFTLMLPPAKATTGGLLLYPSPRPEMSAFDVFRDLQEEVFDEFGRDGTFGGIKSTVIDRWYPPNVYGLRLQDMLHPNHAGHDRIFSAALEGLLAHTPTQYIGAPEEPEVPVDPTLPTKPIIGPPNVDGSTVLFTWTSTAGSSPIAYYDVHVDGATEPVTSLAPTYAAFNVPPSSSVSVQVVAVDTDERRSAKSALSIATTDAAPEVPTLPGAPGTPVIGAPVIRGESITFTWKALRGDNPISHYEIYQTGKATITVTAPEWTAAGLDNDTTVTIRVAALDSAGLRSATSDPRTATTPPEDVMALAPVHGTITDCGLRPLAGRQLRLRFTLSGPATENERLLVTEPVEITPNQYGGFRVDLWETTFLAPATWYDVTAVWLVAGQAPAYQRIPAKLRVPRGGGAIGDLLVQPAPPGVTSWGFGPPERDYLVYFDIAGEQARLYLLGKAATT